VESKKQTQFIFVTGGVLSGLGKGITAASIGNILEARGFKVNIQKLDPYLNVDAGTLNPAEHGECFVTKDGAETDLDLGHYERFLDIELTQLSSMMSGRILRKLIQDERDGKYLGKTVQLVPHFTNAIEEVILEAGDGFDVHIVEIGGTVGDYESPAFFEAIRRMSDRVGVENCTYVQVVYLPYLGASKEIKTKPAQNAARELRSLGINPNFLIARSEEEPAAVDSVRKKLSSFSGVALESIAFLPNAKTVYEVPLTLEAAGIGEQLVNKLKLDAKQPDFTEWKALVAQAVKDNDKTVTIGVVAKYLDNEDTYLCVFEALNAASYKHKVNLNIEWIDAEKLADTDPEEILKDLDGVVVPGGFGERGLEGKIKAARYAMDNDLPYLGLCLGMQMAVVALARKLGYDANTIEADPRTDCPVVHIMDEQEGKTETGGTMRLGDYDCSLREGSKARELYGSETATERHRHRYEFNNKYRDELEAAGMQMVGINQKLDLVELIEMKDHKFFMASQYHPEFKSRPNRAHPLFDGFVAASLGD